MTRRWLALGLTGLILVAVLAAQKKDKPAVHMLRVTFGLKDTKPTDWSGKVEVKDGEIVALEGWRFEAKDQVLPTSRDQSLPTSRDHKGAEWRCTTHEYIAPGERYRLQTPGEPMPKVKEQPWPNGVTLTVQGDQPRIVARFAWQDPIELALSDLKLGEPHAYLKDQVRVERLPDVSLLRDTAPKGGAKPANKPANQPETGIGPQDDYPALWINQETNRHYLAWVCYQNGKDRVLLAERDGPGGAWSEPLEVAGAGDHFRVALASTHADDLWVVWSSQQDGNWDLFARKYDISKPLESGAASVRRSDPTRLTTDSGPDFWHRMTTDSKGRAWLVWQGFRNSQSDIFACCADADGWHPPIKVSDSPANDWDPCICADTKEDRVWVGWDTYTENIFWDYQVRVRSMTGGPNAKLGEIEACGIDQRFSMAAHVSLACDLDGRLWVAWDQTSGQWGKDTGLPELGEGGRGWGLHASRSVGIRVLAGGSWLEPRQLPWEVLPVETRWAHELPQLQTDSNGTIWLAFRHRTCRRPREDGWAAQARWDCLAMAYLGDRWTAPISLPSSAGRNDMRFSSQRDRTGNVFLAYAADNRLWTPPAMTERNLTIAVSRLDNSTRGADLRTDKPLWIVAQPVTSVHLDEEKDVARIRSYKLDHGGKAYRIYRGDLHRHTDISGDGVGDGSLMDLHRYGLDAAEMDFILVADHNMGNDREYPWWRTQKANDLYTVPGRFISMYGYERSVRYPNGHRNVIWTERGHRTLPLPQQAIAAQMLADTGRLYDYLRQTGGICTAHSSATDQGTDWKDFDGSLEPIVEMFQGFQSAYEDLGAPLSIDDKTKIVHQGYKPDGYVARALEKGYKLGFQASSDHVSTHVSYACVLAEEFTRKGLVEAMKKRHTYAATDNIILDFRAGPLGIMGDAITARQPEFQVVAIGTAPLDRVELLRNGKVVHTVKPDKDSDEARFAWQDMAPEKGRENYYYVRVIQKNRHMAWGSPIWVQ